MERHLSVRTTPEITEKAEPALRLMVLGSVELAGPNLAELRSALVQSKRLALLTYLALASPRGFHRRDKLIALFWPELDETRARHALRQAVHTLRRAMGAEVIVGRGDDELAVDRDLLWCDARVFHDLLDSGEEEKAIALYRGDLLPGLFVSGASPELDQWLESERALLRSRASAAAWKLASQAEQRGNGDDAARWARVGMAFSREDEASLRRLISLLDRLGDRAGALRAHDDFSRWIAAEFDAEPSAETKELIDAIRARRQARETTNYAAPSGEPISQSLSFGSKEVHSPVLVTEAFEPPPSSPGFFRRRTAAYVAIAVAVLAVAAFGYAKARDGAARTRTAAPIVAVGNIVESGMSPLDTTGAGATLEELLATDLARVSGLHVVSHARLYEILGQTGNPATTPGAVSDAAHRAGATHLIEGVLYRRNGKPGILRLDLRRVDLATGVVSMAWSAEGKDLFSLSDSMTAQFAVELGIPRPARSLAGTTTTSLVARRFYEEGIRWFYKGEVQTAARYFLAALDEDSTFGMAAYRALGSANLADRRRVIPLLARAARNASQAPERERLLIRYSWAQLSNDPAALALAESLAVRFPNDPDGERSWGSALLWSGDFNKAITHLKRAVARDSLSFSPSAPIGLCPACDASAAIVTSYLYADSVGAAELAARGWIRMQPNSSLSRLALAEVLGRAGRRSEALTEAGQAARIAPTLVRDSWLDLRLALTAGDFPEAHRLLVVRSQDVDQGFGEEAMWWKIITLRYEGRMTDASAVVARFCDGKDAPGFETNRSLDCSLAAGPVLFEQGKYRETGRLYEAIPVSKELFGAGAPPMIGLVARHKSWMLTHAASAYAADGDTVRLKALTDSVEGWGRLSALGRDRLMHFHLRGLLLAARGRHSEAVDMFRNAMYAPSDGYTRTNFELARELIASGRPREAIGPLRSALHGPIQGANLYVTQTEIHYLLADAFEKAGAGDSAAVHYARVASAWQHSDPAFRARLVDARRKAGIVH